jgi:hypothetical protein
MGKSSSLVAAVEPPLSGHPGFLITRTHRLHKFLITNRMRLTHHHLLQPEPRQKPTSLPPESAHERRSEKHILYLKYAILGARFRLERETRCTGYEGRISDAVPSFPEAESRLCAQGKGFVAAVPEYQGKGADSLPRMADSRSSFSSQTASIATSAGVMPGIRPAWPSVAGRISEKRCCASFLRPWIVV